MPVGVMVIVPVGDIFDPQAMEREITDALQRSANFGVGLLKRTTTTWKKRPEFYTGEVAWLSRRNLAIHFGTDDEIWTYVDQGTKPHIIRARKRPTLRFRTGYKAKTKPRTFTSYSGGASGPWRAPVVVHHPGTEARKFSDEVTKNVERDFEKRADQVIRNVVARNKAVKSKRVKR